MGEKSEPFPVDAGVRQGCVLAPVLFNLFLASVTSVADRDVRAEDCLTLSYRLMVACSICQHTQSVSILDLQYADDAAIVGSTGEGLQRSLNSMARAYGRAGLRINAEKTEVLTQLQNPTITRKLLVDDRELKEVSSFRYLGSVLSDYCDLGEEVQRRIGLAAASFGKLSNRIFHNWSLSLRTKVKVYRAICISILLYGCEAWVPYRRHIRALELFHIRYLQRMMGIKWWHRVPHLEIRHRAGIDPLECILAHRQLRWAAPYTLRRSSGRLSGGGLEPT